MTALSVTWKCIVFLLIVCLLVVLIALPTSNLLKRMTFPIARNFGRQHCGKMLIRSFDYLVFVLHGLLNLYLTLKVWNKMTVWPNLLRFDSTLRRLVTRSKRINRKGKANVTVVCMMCKVKEYKPVVWIVWYDPQSCPVKNRIVSPAGECRLLLRPEAGQRLPVVEHRLCQYLRTASYEDESTTKTQFIELISNR